MKPIPIGVIGGDTLYKGGRALLQAVGDPSEVTASAASCPTGEGVRIGGDLRSPIIGKNEAFDDMFEIEV
jgi:hypothetical protein